MCVQLFKEWVSGSKHYPLSMEDFSSCPDGDFQIARENVKFSIEFYKDEKIDIAACRLESRETNIVWYSDCVYICESGIKSILVQINCQRLNFNALLPVIHKPYILKTLIHSDFCDTDNTLATTDTPISIRENDIEICADVINGESSNIMPVVYISNDGWGYSINPTEIAAWLGGVAHVLIESNISISQKLRYRVNDRNAHNGFVGIYFPVTAGYSLFNPKDFKDRYELEHEIIDTIWQALINKVDQSMYNWDQVVMLKSKQKMRAWETSSKNNKAELDAFIQSFDSESSNLQQKIENLYDQNMRLKDQINVYKESLRSCKSNGVLSFGIEHDLYPGEIRDLLMNLISQAIDKYPNPSRAFDILKSLIDVNPVVGECNRIMTELKSILCSNKRINSTSKAALSDLGFRIDDSGSTHYKLEFYDPRYKFVVSKTPSDHREGKNLFSDINKIINVERRI